MDVYITKKNGVKIPYHRMSKSQKIYYHKRKRDKASSILINKPDMNVNDVRTSAMYHHNCILKNSGNKKFQRRNKTLHKWAVNYAIKHKDKPLFSVRRKYKNDYKI